MNLHGFDPIFLVMPRYGLFWGRPGEDWRIAGLDDSDIDGRTRVLFEGTDEPNMRGSADVDGDGTIHRLELGDVEWTLHSVSYEPCLDPALDQILAAAWQRPR
jgi:hypothetical protein